jgi:two-component system cell cycle response regulator DivK
MKADKERSQTAGCDAYIVKPLRYKELYAVMEHLLQKPPRPGTPATSPGPHSI